MMSVYVDLLYRKAHILYRRTKVIWCFYACLCFCHRIACTIVRIFSRDMHQAETHLRIILPNSQDQQAFQYHSISD